MKNRNKWIAIIFLIFIFTVPVVTVVRGFMPAQETVSEAEQAVLNNNGSTNEGKHGDASAKEEEMSSEAVTEEKQPLFTRIQNSLNNFLWYP